MFAGNIRYFERSMLRRTISRLREHSAYRRHQRRAARSLLPPLVFLGDSHVDYLSQATVQGLFGNRLYGLCHVAGATAVGLRNPNQHRSTTNALGLFSDYLDKWTNQSIVILQLGEVDCGFVIWYRAAKYQDGIDKQLEESIAAYFGFIDQIRARGYSKIIVTGATYPTIKDGENWGDVANARKEITATMAERTALTARYNARLREEAASRGLPFADIAEDVLDPATGLMKAELYGRNLLDHHMDIPRAAQIWARHLTPVLEQYPPLTEPAAPPS